MCTICGDQRGGEMDHLIYFGFDFNEKSAFKVYISIRLTTDSSVLKIISQTILFRSILSDTYT